MLRKSRQGRKQEHGFPFAFGLKRRSSTSSPNGGDGRQSRVVPPQALALLAAQPAWYSTRACVVTWRKQPRILQIRANVLLVFRRNVEPDLSNVEFVIALSASSHLKQLVDQQHSQRTNPHDNTEQHHTIYIGGLSFYFRHARHADDFRTALIRAAENCRRRTAMSTSLLSFSSLASSSDSSALLSLDPDSKLPAKASPLPPRYSIVRVIGVGASGVVHAARMHGSNALYAIKTIPNHEKKSNKDKNSDASVNNDATKRKYDVLLSPTLLSSVVTERLFLQRAAEKKCPFIIRLVDAFESENGFHFVTELAEWGNLCAIVSQIPDRRFPERVARLLFAELVAALLCTHGMGYLYRDMKMSNVLINSHGHVRLADFGLCKPVRMVDRYHPSTKSNRENKSTNDMGAEFLYESAHTAVIGRVKSFVGTRMYMAPEQIAVEASGRSCYGAPADIWSLGVILYTILTGTYPFVARKSPAAAAGRGDGASDNDNVDDKRGDGFPADDEIDHNTLTWKIVHQRISIPSFVSKSAANLLSCLLCRDESRRIDLCSIMMHEWLSDIDWSDLYSNARSNRPVGPVVDFLRSRDVPPVVPIPGVSHEDSEGEETAKEEQFDSFVMKINKVLSQREEETFDSTMTTTSLLPSSSSRPVVPTLLGFSYLPHET